jgi:hypothetical protein
VALAGEVAMEESEAVLMSNAVVAASRRLCTVGPQSRIRSESRRLGAFS